MINDLFKIINEPEKILFVGIGNRFRNDDYVGIYISEELKKHGKFNVLIAENSLENFIGKINKINPQKLIIIDALNINREPGYFELIRISHIFDHTANTHTISLRQLSTLFKTDDICILGIQPMDISFGTKLSEPVLKAAERIINKIIKSDIRKPKTYTP